MISSYPSSTEQLLQSSRDRSTAPLPGCIAHRTVMDVTSVLRSCGFRNMEDDQFKEKKMAERCVRSNNFIKRRRYTGCNAPEVIESMQTACLWSMHRNRL